MADCHTVMMRQETVSNSLPKDNIDPSLSKRMSAMHLIHYSALYNDRKPPKSHLKRVTAYHGWLCQQLMFYSVVSDLISADGSLIRMHYRSVQMRVKHEEAESVLVLLYIRFDATVKIYLKCEECNSKINNAFPSSHKDPWTTSLKDFMIFSNSRTPMVSSRSSAASRVVYAWAVRHCEFHFKGKQQNDRTRSLGHDLAACNPQ